ncbi:EamA family transporter [Labrenzia sp. 011]|uniref:EamA family transporter n=1 Tax=Labrenzia sp. 011 TaxID=2171494 RepID=UPI000D50688B|nr:EamA family transporter [Labrenzia sp. 011]PVB63472.1 EamA/RhaT family transporter [Labrenzia sp. 011]
MADTTGPGQRHGTVSPGSLPAGNAAARLLDRPVSLLLVVGGFLALSTIIAKAAPVLGWHPLALLQWSILGGAAGLFALTRISTLKGARTGEPVDRRKFAVYLGCSGLLFVVPNMIAVVAASKVGAGFVSLSYAFPLVLTYAIAVLLRLEHLQLLRGGGVLAGLAGAVLLAVSGSHLSIEASWWSILALSIPVFLAAGNIYRTLKWPKGAGPADLAVGMMAVGFVALVVFNTAMDTPAAPVSWTSGAIGLLVAQIAIFTLQYGLYFRLQQTAGPVYLSQIGSVAAVTGLGLGYLIFGEIPDLARLGAVFSVGAGIVLVTMGRPRTP